MKSKPIKKRVLILCNHNAARSQMAEGILKSLKDEYYEVYSAGNTPSTVSPFAISVMKEIGIDISHHRSKDLTEFKGEEFGYVVTVCSGEGEACPFFPGGKEYLNQAFEDPGAVKGTDEEKLEAFRQIRDEIREWIKNTFRVE